MKKGLVKWTYFKTNKQKKAVSANKRNIFLKKVIKYVLSHPMSLAGIWEVILNLCKFNSFPPVILLCQRQDILRKVIAWTYHYQRISHPI